MHWSRPFFAGFVVIAASCAPKPGTIGAVIGQQTDGRLFLREVPEDLAAGEAGLMAGDEVLLIDGRDVRPMSSAAVHEMLIGEIGTTVKLTIVRDGEVLRRTLVRTEARRRGAGRPRR